VSDCACMPSEIKVVITKKSIDFFMIDRLMVIIYDV